jgi:hypothetical protein
MAYPVKAVCEAKDIRVNGTSIIYIQFYAKDGKRRLNTGLSIPPKFWNQKQRIVTDKLPVDFGLYTQLNTEITRQLRLSEDLIAWGEQEHKRPIGVFVKETFRPDLDLNQLKLGIHPGQQSFFISQSRLCHACPTLPQIAPYKAIIIHAETPLNGGMIFPNLPADSPKNGRPWPNVFNEIEQYIKDKTGDVDPKTLQVYKNMGDHMKQFETHRQEPVSFLSFDFNFYD